MQLGTNVPQPENATVSSLSVGVQGGSTITPKETVQAVDEKINKGLMVREAARVVAKKTGKNRGNGFR